jgi:D-amino peptidase
MRGTADGVLNHTISGRSIHGVTVNGKPTGETGLNAALAGSFGVPVVMVAGDEAVCREAKELLPEILTAQTKRGIGSVAAESLHPDKACRQISEAAKEAVSRRESISPLVIDGQVEVAVDFVRTGMADCAVMIPGTERKSATTVSYTAPDYREAYRVVRAMIMMAGKYPS